MRSKKFLSILNILLIFAGGLLIASGVFLYFRKKAKTDDDNDVDEVEKREPQSESDTSLLTYYKNIIETLNNRFDNVVDVAILLTSQAAHETGIFTSRLFIEQNNLFGMRQPVSRNTTSTGELNNYASYNTIADSVEDILLWFNAKYINISHYEASKEGVKRYVQMLKDNKYFTASITEYRNAVTKYSVRLRELLGAG